MATDNYGRTVGIISSDRNHTSSHYNLQMLELGQAHCYMLAGDHKAEYEAAETIAKNKGLGIWKEPNFERPAAFRRRHEADEKKRSSFKVKLIAAAIIAAAAAMAYYVFADDIFAHLRSLTDKLTG